MMKKVFIISIFVLVIISTIIVVYAKTNIIKESDEEVIATSTYNALPLDIYQEMFDFENTFIEKEPISVEELYNLSNYVLIVEITDKDIVGKGIINNAEVKRVIKGNDIKIGDNIYVYDLVAFVAQYSFTYLDGSTPLKVGSEYIIFVNKTKRANVKNSYIATSTKYSYVSLIETPILEHYENNSKFVNDISNYQYVFLENSDEELEQYRNFISKIRIKYGD